MKVTLIKGAVGGGSAFLAAGVSAARSAKDAVSHLDKLEQVLRVTGLVLAITVSLLTAISMVKKMWDGAKERRDRRPWDE